MRIREVLTRMLEHILTQNPKYFKMHMWTEFLIGAELKVAGHGPEPEVDRTHTGTRVQNGSVFSMISKGLFSRVQFVLDWLLRGRGRGQMQEPSHAMRTQ
jgi:hypothetical protein